MQTTAEGPPESCACLPQPLKECIQKGMLGLCVQCNTAFEKDPDNRAGGSVLIPCGRQTTIQRVHATSILFHVGECARLWMESYQSSVLSKLSDYAPFVFSGKPKDTIEFFRKQCIENHVLVMAFCAFCGIQAQQHYRFKTCSGCRNVRYCGEECQNKDWKKHQLECVPKQKGPIITYTTTPKSEAKVEICECFNNHEKEVSKRSSTNQCSYPPCEYVLANDAKIPLSVFVFECSKKNAPFHMIPTKYCSQRCQIKNTQKK